MNAAEKDIDREIVPGLVEDLRDLPDGTRITLDELIAESFFADEAFDDEAMAYLCKRLYSSAEKEKIILENSDGSSFIVHNGAAKFICPYCGSKNTAHIMYGLPDFSPELVRRLDEGRLRLGGCVLSFASGDRYCNHCGREFFTFSSGNMAQKNGPEKMRSGPEPGADKPEDPEQAESLTFTFSIIDRMTVEYQLRHITEAAIGTCLRGPYLAPANGKTEERMISEADWYDLIRQLYDRFKFHEWDPEYVNDRIPKGIEWSVTVQFPNNKIQQRSGRNAHPACWADFSDRILSFFR